MSDDDADADRDVYLHHRDGRHELQAAIDAVAAADLGTDREAILSRLEHELRARHHWPQPHTWVEAVVEELQVGHAYHVAAD